MNKLILIIPTLKQGGAERVMSELANEFSRNGNAVHLILLAKSEDFYEINSNVTIHRLTFENKGILYKIYSEIKTFFILRKLIKKEKPDAILSFMEKYNVFVILASRFINTKVFVSDRSNPKKTIPLRIEILRRITYKYATGIVSQTSLSKEILGKKTGNSNIKVIPNPIKSILQNPNIHKEKIILNVGRLVPEKGQKFLIQAFSKVKNKEWKLVILGDGPLKQELNSQIENLQLKEQIFMPGAVKNIDEWLAKASIFAFPSISEGFPNALLEAMVTGLPCISFDCDAGPRDIIIDGVNGFLIPTENVEQLHEKIELLIENPQLRHKLGENAKSISSELNIENIANQYLAFLRGQL